MDAAAAQAGRETGAYRKLSLAGQCDLAEYLWALELDRREALRFAAGAAGVRGYQPPSEELADWLAAGAQAAAEAPARGEERAAEVAALAAALGGEGG